MKLELRKISRDLLSMEDTGELEKRVSTLEQLLESLKADVKRLVGSKEKKRPVSTSGAIGISGIELPRIKVPNFDGNILNWQFFWEQCNSAIHSKHLLTDSDSLTYLREALKSRPARNVVESLTQMSESCNEAIRHLQKR